MSGVTEDFLNEDVEIPSQKFVCVSFLKPTEVVQRKNLFLVHKFLQKMSETYDLDLKTVTDMYDDFVYANRVELSNEFDELVDFKTSVYGIKVRGSYSTQKEASMRAKVLQTRDPNHNVYVCSVGKWLGFDFEADDVESQEYANEELNTLMKAYVENRKHRDTMFQEETRTRVETARKEGAEAIEAMKTKMEEEARLESEKVAEASEELKNSIENSLTRSLEETDPWMARKEEVTKGPDFDEI